MIKLAVLCSQSWYNFNRHEMFRTFNCGIGMILIVDKNSVDEISAHLKDSGESFYKIGRVVEGASVKIRGDFFND